MNQDTHKDINRPDADPGDICQTRCLHDEAVERARQALPEHGTLMNAAELFKMLGDPTRLAIVQALAAEELCVCDLAALLGMTSSAVSHQLRLLRSARLVAFRKEGKIVFYRLDDHHVETLLAQGLAHADHD